MKRLLVLILPLIILLPNTLLSQSLKTKVFLYDNDWMQVKNRSEASFERIISFDKLDVNENYPVDWVKDFYIDAGIQCKGKFSYYDAENNENNKPHGVVFWYYENGIKSRESYYDNGILYGKTTFWHNNGQVESFRNYVNGKIDGSVEVYNTKGARVQSIDYKNGKIDGAVEFYNTKGAKVQSIDYKNGKIDGLIISYYENGNPKSIKEYKGGKQIDKFIIELDEYDDCKWVAKDNFKDNINNWPIGENSSGSCSYLLDTVKQEYSILGKGNYIFPALIHLGVNPFSEYVIESRLKQTRKGEEGSYGLLFGFKDWDNYMHLQIKENENSIWYKVNRKDDGIIEPIIKDWKKTEVQFFKKDYNTFQIRQSIDYEEGEMVSITLIFAINGHIIEEANSKKLSGFNFGFSATGNNSHITADYLQIRYPCPTSFDKEVISEIPASCSGYGSGFVINSDGYLATNYHVVKECLDVKIIGLYGDTSSVNVVLRDSINDLAILKSRKWFGELPYKLLDDEIDVLEKVYTYGYPKASILGTGLKTTDGSITSLEATSINDVKYYQHNATIMSGNSGGPLFNEDGNVVGVNTLSGKTDVLENVSAAIKTRYLTRLMRDNNISSSSRNTLKGKKPSEQHKIIRNYIYLVLVND